jgi:hypothetical protein
MKIQALLIRIAQQNMKKMDKTKRTFNQLNSSAFMQENKNKCCNINFSISFIVHMFGHAQLHLGCKKIGNPSSSIQFPFQHS